MLRRDSERFVDAVESLGEEAPDHPVSRWIAGALTPSILGLHAVQWLWAGRAPFVAGRPLRWTELHGAEAACLAGAALAGAAFLHAHFFWTPHPHYHGYGALGKLASLVGFIAALAGFVWYGFLNA
ncbi:hypothetical protein LzC2_11890 [Planctomycetes bacterium LzC2]|uniref:Uncharacterized protein n=2 Tax=Alienimonas chondri TaxID=2681879 RepID=A0ABX1VDJ1_9PLAN|nr:hypothetical protein [Alienimonas chondri]